MSEVPLIIQYRTYCAFKADGGLKGTSLAFKAEVDSVHLLHVERESARAIHSRTGLFRGPIVAICSTHAIDINARQARADVCHLRTVPSLHPSTHHPGLWRVLVRVCWGETQAQIMMGTKPTIL